MIYKMHIKAVFFFNLKPMRFLTLFIIVIAYYVF